MKLPKKVRGSATFALLILIAFSICLILLGKFLKNMHLKNKLFIKTQELKTKQAINLYFLKKKIRIIIFKSIANKLDNDHKLISTDELLYIIHNQIIEKKILNQYIIKIKYINIKCYDPVSDSFKFDKILKTGAEFYSAEALKTDVEFYPTEEQTLKLYSYIIDGKISLKFIHKKSKKIKKYLIKLKDIITYSKKVNNFTFRTK